jgi:hypothetical protein
MPLQSGTRSASLNGNVSTVQIGSVGVGGVVSATVGPFSAGGFWDEDAQKLTLFVGASSAGGPEVYTAYLFTDPVNLTGVTGSVIFTLTGFVECFQVTSPFVVGAAKRSVFGWYAQIGVD